VLLVAAAAVWGRVRFRLQLSREPDGPVVVSGALACLRWRRRLPRIGDVAAWLERAAVCGAWPQLPRGFAAHLIGQAAGRRLLARLAWAARGTRIIRFNARARLGTGDAAATGLLIGWCWSVLSLVRPLLRGTTPRVRLEPEFDRPWLEFDVHVAGDVPLGRTLVVAAGVGGVVLRWQIRRIAGTWLHDIKALGRRRREEGVGS